MGVAGMRRARLVLSAEVLLSMLEAGSHRGYKVIEHAVPKDAEVYGIGCDRAPPTEVHIYFSTSDERVPISEGETDFMEWPNPVMRIMEGV